MLREVDKQMFDLKNVANETKIRLCLDCGKCTVVCPVARYDQGFNPRLIVQGALRQNSHEPVDESIWSCIGCNMCVERCNYNVKFTDFIRFLRSRALSEGFEVKCSHNGIPQVTMHMMANKDIKQDRLKWLPKNIKVKEQNETAFFVGCAPYFDVLFSDLGIKTIEGTKGALTLLNRAQIPFTLLPNERCCGRDLLLMGDTKEFLSLAQANLDEFSQRGIKDIITACSECYYTLKVDYPRFLKKWHINVRHVAEIIAPLIENNQLALGKLGRKVTYHDPCALGRHSRIFKQPRCILDSILDLELVEMADNREKALCCGASPWAHCGSVNKQIQKERLAQAKATGADILVTACPKCQIHLKCAQKNAENNDVCQIEIQDIFDLTAQSLLPQEVS
jgi:heterodisulfide reductase subunit D